MSVTEIQQYNDLSPALNKLSGDVVDCAFQVHRELGPGFLESVYEDAMMIELQQKGLAFERQKSCQIPYKGQVLTTEHRFDFVVEGQIIVELKAVDKIHPVHKAQIYSYLNAAKLQLGLLLNFNVPLMKYGIGRYVLRTAETPRSEKGA